MDCSIDEIKKAVENSISFASVCRYLGLQEKGSNFNMLKEKIKEYGLSKSAHSKVSELVLFVPNRVTVRKLQNKQTGTCNLESSGFHK